MVIWTPIPALPTPPTPPASALKPKTVTRLKFAHSLKKKKKQRCSHHWNASPSPLIIKFSFEDPEAKE